MTTFYSGNVFFLYAMFCVTLWMQQFYGVCWKSITMNAKACLAIIGVFIGCCSNVVFLELLVINDPGSGNLITFSQFLFIGLEGLIFAATTNPKIPLKNYSILVFMFFVTSVCNNYAFAFNIPMPLHMIFRAGSLIANMIMGALILKRRYNYSKYSSVLTITIGITICTVISGNDVKQNNDSRLDEAESGFFVWFLGITLLSIALFISAFMGIYQETLYKRFGKHPREALFYTHIIPLPGFFLMYQNIREHFMIAGSSENIELPVFFVDGFAVHIPQMILYLICNVVTQYLCIRSVYVLTTECTSLTVTLVVTLRKFLSLLFSILYFKNPFTVYHWVGTSLVFFGTIVFTEVVPRIAEQFNVKKIDKFE